MDEKPTNVLTGQWHELNLTGFGRSLKFNASNEFVFSAGDHEGHATNYYGTYQLNGDSLKISIKEKLIQEPGKPAVKSPSNHLLYEKAIFKVLGDTLVLNYITYPADAPIATTAKFRRAIVID